ncbi:unnamed protein product [Trichogramma brassicae]|uniref:Uncharacterized protein n=1 Tax=Trichogramma brassicae TaxID=86971 RepID=A0A6H5HWJ0_9HYME|nr:unnamed protein product [Trichogramma brassicae]
MAWLTCFITCHRSPSRFSYIVCITSADHISTNLDSIYWYLFYNFLRLSMIHEGWTERAKNLSHRMVAEALLRRHADPNFADDDGYTALHVICTRDKDDGLLKEFFKIVDEIPTSVQVDAKDRFGNTPLHLAAAGGKLKLVELLLKRQADPNSTNEEGLTPLHVICTRNKDDGLLKEFFKIVDEIPTSVQVDAKDRFGNTPLHLAAAGGYLILVELLLKRQADPNSTNEEGLTPLHVICTRNKDDGLLKEFFKIVDEIPTSVQVDAKDRFGNTPLHLAAAGGKLKLVELLLKRQADPNSTNEEGLTPLHVICKRDKDDGLLKEFFKIVDEIPTSVQVDAKDRFGNTPLHLAAAGGYLILVELLLKRQADPNSTNEEGLTPLHVICTRNKDDGLLKEFFKIVDEIPTSVQVDAKDRFGNTPLHLAAAGGYLILVELLLKRQADPNSTNEEGLTPLHVICKREVDGGLARQFFMVADDMKKQVRINAQDKKGNSPLHFALSRCRNRGLVEVLLHRGADPNLANEEGQTPLHLVCNKDHKDNTAYQFFEKCKFKKKPVEVDAKDKQGRTPLQLAVANLLIEEVNLLSIYGADPSKFVFPSRNDFYEALGYPRRRQFVYEGG